MQFRLKIENNSQDIDLRESAAYAATNRSDAANLNTLLWTIQGLLAALFAFAGGMKLMLPVAELTQQTQLSGAFVRFIGVAETLGAIGLILPGLLQIRPRLTAFAAAGLVAIMIGATVLTLAGEDLRMASVPLITGLLSVFVVYGRSRRSLR
jgi:uncharacterized membrane protein YphA (DoxX/SURF4 family)